MYTSFISLSKFKSHDELLVEFCFNLWYVLQKRILTIRNENKPFTSHTKQTSVLKDKALHVMSKMYHA